MSNTTSFKDELPLFETSPRNPDAPNKLTLFTSKAKLAPLKGASHAPSDKLMKFFTPTNKNEWNWQNLTLQRSVESQNKTIFK
jgi:hypothetical protein